MNQRVVHQLIDFGFSVGLHGHQHYPAAAPYELRLPNLTTMAVVSAGSLAVGNHELPMGEKRQFNIVVADPENEELTVHVRAMSPGGVFMGSYRDDFGGRTSITLPLKHSPSRPDAPTALQLLDDAIAAVAARTFDKALPLLDRLGSAYGAERRQVLIEALTGLGRTDDLLEVLDPPQSVDEAIRLVVMRIDRGEFDEAERGLTDGGDLIDRALVGDLRARIEAERAMRT